jgi:hypothetical protein
MSLHYFKDIRPKDVGEVVVIIINIDYYLLKMDKLLTMHMIRIEL